MMLRTDKAYFVPLISLVGAMGIIDTAILNPTIAAFAASLGASEALAGLITGLYSIVAIPASIVMGLTIDAIGRRRALIAGLGFTALWIYGYSIAANPLDLIIFRTTHAISGSLVFPASIAMIVDAARRKMGRNIGLYWLVIGSVIALGSGLSRVLVTSLGFRWMFVLVALLSLAGFFLALIVPETAKIRMKPRKAASSIASSIRWLSVAYLSIFSLYFAFGAIVGALSLILIRGGAGQEAAAGSVAVYIGLATVTSLPLFYLVGRLLDRFGPVRALVLGISLAGVSQALLLVSLSSPLFFTSAFALGGGIALVFVASTAVAALPKARGASIGLHQTANIAGVAAGAPLSGLFLQFYGALAPFAIAASVQAVVLAIIIASRRFTKQADLQIMGGPSDAAYHGLPRERE